MPHTDDGALNLWGTRNAANFVEKPDLVQARELVRAGGLWNTMIMVFKVRTVLKMMQRLFPTTYLHFARIFEAIDTPEEKQAVESVYQNLEPMNFSKSFLEKIAAIDPAAISVLPVVQVFWSDMGSPERGCASAGATRTKAGHTEARAAIPGSSMASWLKKKLKT